MTHPGFSCDSFSEGKFAFRFALQAQICGDWQMNNSISSLNYRMFSAKEPLAKPVIGLNCARIKFTYCSNRQEYFLFQSEAGIFFGIIWLGS